MFKNEKEAFVQEAETVIAPSVRVEGDFVSQGNIRIEGAVSGSVDTKQDLLVGKDAEITADVSACNAVISGTLHGNLRVTESLELTSTARIFGDVQAKIMSVAGGAMLDGKLVIGGESKKTGTRNVEKEEAPKAEAEEEETEGEKSAREKKIEEVLQH